MHKKYLKYLTICTICIIFLVLGLFYRITNIDDPLGIDGSDYAVAAKKGFSANYFDKGSRPFGEFFKIGLLKVLTDEDIPLAREDALEYDVAELRHYHPPLFFYLLTFSQNVFGDNYAAYRLVSVFFGILCCLIISVIVYMAVENNKILYATLAFSLLWFSQTHILVSKYVSTHSLFTFLSYLAFFILIIAIHRKRNFIFILFFSVLALCFLTLEYAVLVALTAVLFLVITKQPWLGYEKNNIYINSAILIGLFVFVSMITIVWPAGILDLNILKGYAAYSGPLRSSSISYKYVSAWYDVYIKMFKNDPIALFTFIILIISTIVFVVKKYKIPKILFLFVIYSLLIIFINIKVSATKVHYISYIIPSIIILCCVIMSYVVGSDKRFIYITLGIVFLIASINFNSLAKTAVGASKTWTSVAQRFKSDNIVNKKILTVPHPYWSILKYNLPNNEILTPFSYSISNATFASKYDYVVLNNLDNRFQLNEIPYEPFNIVKKYTNSENSGHIVVFANPKR